MTENKNFLEQEEKFLKELLEKYRAKNPKEEINLEEEIKKLEDEIKKNGRRKSQYYRGI